jgi:hypothetical protein
MGKETQTFKCRKDTDKIWQSFMIKKKKTTKQIKNWMILHSDKNKPSWKTHRKYHTQR